MPRTAGFYLREIENTLAWANLNLRCAERVLIRLGVFPAKSFDALFEGVRALPWEQFIPRDGSFPVKGYSLDSALHSIPDCQRIVKKAVVERFGTCLWSILSSRKPARNTRYSFPFMRDTAEAFSGYLRPGAA